MMCSSKLRPTAGYLLALICSVLCMPPAPAQQTTGSVTGVVQDTTGAIIPHATVTLTDLETKSERKTTSNATGNFAIASVPSGLQYQLTVSIAGFEGWQSRPFALRPGDQVGFTDVKLNVGSVNETLTVESGSSQAVKPLDTPERSDVITEGP